MRSDHQDDARPGIETITAQALGHIAPPFREIVPPIHVATTYVRNEDGVLTDGRLYARDASPAYDQPEAVLRELESGVDALLFPSGMAAATAVLQCLRAGDKLVVPQVMYWALRGWVRRFADERQIELVEYENGSLGSLRAALAGTPARLLWIETPANPTWEVTDILAATRLAHTTGTMVAVDSTVATPVHSRPLALGADIVMHSATKYLNGHSDVLAGALVTREQSALWQQIRLNRGTGGAILGAFEAWLLLRGLRTLFLRVRASSASAAQIAHFLAAHPAVEAVHYPGLSTHPHHAVAARQMHNGFGGMLSVRIKGGAAAARRVAGRLKLFKEATSLGSVESLVEHRAPVEGPETRCPPDLLRLSVGIEQTQDLIDDLARALDDMAT